MQPAAAVIPKNDPSLAMGRYGPIWPKPPACYGFTLIAKVKAGRADTIRNRRPAEYHGRLARGTSPFMHAVLQTLGRPAPLDR